MLEVAPVRVASILSQRDRLVGGAASLEFFGQGRIAFMPWVFVAKAQPCAHGAVLVERLRHAPSILCAWRAWLREHGADQTAPLLAGWVCFVGADEGLPSSVHMAGVLPRSRSGCVAKYRPLQSPVFRRPCWTWCASQILRLWQWRCGRGRIG